MLPWGYFLQKDAEGARGALRAVVKPSIPAILRPGSARRPSRVLAHGARLFAYRAASRSSTGAASGWGASSEKIPWMALAWPSWVFSHSLKRE